MNYIQCLIDRQLGIYCRLNYDHVLKRLVVHSEESFYGLQSSVLASFDQDPPIFACRFSEAPGYEHILALANEDGRVAIQDTSTAATALKLEGFQCHNNAVFDLAWMPGYMNFVTVSGDHTACLWDVAEGPPKRIQVFSSHTRSVKTAVFRPNEPTVFATGARDGHILIWDTRAGAQPSAVVLKPDNCLWNCHSSFAPKTPGSHSKRARLDAPRATSITGLAFQDAATLLSCGECDGNIKVWDLRKSYSAYRREPLPKRAIPYCGSSTRNGYTNLVVDDARVRLYASCMDDVIYCFNVATYGALPERRYVGHENSTFYIKTGLSPDGAYLVSGSSDKHAYVWNTRAAEPVVRLAGHWAEVTCAAWARTPDLRLVTCSDDARHKIWRLGPEHMDADAARELRGRAEPAPARAPARPPPATPTSHKRKRAAPPHPADGAAKRARAAPPASPAPRGTKRCLADLLNAADGEPKRPRPDPPGADAPAPYWGYIPTAGASFLTPTKNYERRTCKKLSPRSPKPISPNSVAHRSPVKVSPAKVRIISFTTPTKDLPNFVLDGEAPHLRLMSPARKKRESPDWLTLLARERRARTGDQVKAADSAPAPPSPRDGTLTPTRRNSVTEKTPKSSSKNCRTLLKYFKVADK